LVQLPALRPTSHSPLSAESRTLPPEIRLAHPPPPPLFPFRYPPQPPLPLSPPHPPPPGHLLVPLPASPSQGTLNFFITPIPPVPQLRLPPSPLSPLQSPRYFIYISNSPSPSTHPFHTPLPNYPPFRPSSFPLARIATCHLPRPRSSGHTFNPRGSTPSPMNTTPPPLLHLYNESA